MHSIDVDVHLVNTDVDFDVDDSILDVHPIVGTNLCSWEVDVL